MIQIAKRANSCQMKAENPKGTELRFLPWGPTGSSPKDRPQLIIDSEAIPDF